MGGIVEVIMIIFGFFLFPISEHSFYLKAARMLYYARTKDEKLFSKTVDPDEEDKLEKYMDPSKFMDNSSGKLI